MLKYGWDSCTYVYIYIEIDSRKVGNLEHYGGNIIDSSHPGNTKNYLFVGYYGWLNMKVKWDYEDIYESNTGLHGLWPNGNTIWKLYRNMGLYVILYIYIYIQYVGLIGGFSSTPCLICPGYHSAQAWKEILSHPACWFWRFSCPGSERWPRLFHRLFSSWRFCIHRNLPPTHW